MPLVDEFCLVDVASFDFSHIPLGPPHIPLGPSHIGPRGIWDEPREICLGESSQSFVLTAKEQKLTF